MAVSAALAQALAAGRKTFNARVAAARVRSPGFDIAGFGAFLEQQADPLVAAVAAQEPDSVQRCAAALFDMGIELVVHGFAAGGTRAPLAGRVWNEIAPGMIALVARDPVESLGALTNAAVQLGKIDGVDGDGWVTAMAALASAARDSGDLRVLAAIAAWRCGAAHLRDGALAAAATLPPALACAAGGASGDDWPALAGAYARNRWWRPDGAPEAGARGLLVGQFTGFGGRFSQPPQVRACEQGFFVSSGERTFLLIADVYGATLHTAAAEEFAAAPATLPDTRTVIDRDAVIAPDRRIALDWPADGLALACNRDTIAVTSPYSHMIRVLPRVLA